MVKTLYYLAKEIRPRQWIKNFLVFIPVFFTGKILNPQLFSLTFLAFLAFCAGSSSIYILNDITDIEKDRAHPFKRHRPIASGKLPVRLAIVSGLLLTVLAMFIASSVSVNFLLVLVGFYILHISYSFYLKNIILLDILTIAAGFILRVFGGEIASGFHINIWLFLTIISISLFLAIGKRRSELTLLTGWNGSLPAKTRATLSHYSEKMLDVYISMFANSAWITYAFYSFLERPPVLRTRFRNLFEENDLSTLQERKWLMLTIPLALYGIMRYLQLIYEKNQGESPEKVLLSDRPLIITSAVLAAMLFAIIYIIGK